ncbi:hypothetical protein [Phenylobacterium sp. J367]|uniref:hypothetical protein n=1 Tax=Phenylobacterium sp. J367 TaxID=2898435 RepID=UPI0035B31C38
MAGQLVYASFEGFKGSGPEGQTQRAVRLRTDETGKAAFQVTQPGRWFITLINMQPATGDATYESNWATLTFGID